MVPQHTVHTVETSRQMYVWVGGTFFWNTHTLTGCFVCPSANKTIRLVNGTKPCQGRVEVFRGGKWGTVCDDGWNLAAGQVVCSQLGCGKAYRITGEQGPFSPGSGDILLDELNCTGTETNLWQCGKWSTNYTHDCGHKEDAGVVCTGRSSSDTMNEFWRPVVWPVQHVMANRNLHPHFLSTATNELMYFHWFHTFFHTIFCCSFIGVYKCHCFWLEQMENIYSQLYNILAICIYMIFWYI